jgi:site-specific DNA-methyltransferase (adenine-specific)
MINPALFSSHSNEWATPQAFFDRLNRVFQFTLDPACTRENAKCARYYTQEDNGLAHSWLGERVFLNPPYSREIAQWVAKARQEAEQGALVVGLLPARTDTRWWHEHVQGHAEIRFLAGRLKFGNSESSAPFPSAIVIWAGLNFLYERGWSRVKQSVGSRKMKDRHVPPGLLSFDEVFTAETARKNLDEGYLRGE